MKQQFKRPESVLVVIYTAIGDVLVLRRTQPKNFWQSVTGSLRWGELPRQAALREVFEETGLRVNSSLVDMQHTEQFPIIPPWRKRYGPTAHHNVEHWFSVALPTRRIIRLNPKEHTSYRWMNPEQAVRKMTSRTNQLALQQLGLSVPV